MSGWTGILFLVTAALLGYLLYQQIRSNPQAFSAANMSKSFYTMGLLALGLIGFIWILVLLLKS